MHSAERINPFPTHTFLLYVGEGYYPLPDISVYIFREGHCPSPANSSSEISVDTKNFSVYNVTICVESW